MERENRKSRSLLFVPAKSENWLLKGLASNADHVIFDLEDSIALTDKERARSMLVDFLSASLLEAGRVYVRINDCASESFEEDLRALSQLEHVNIMLPKANAPTDIENVQKLLGSHNRKAIIPIIETAQGLWNAKEIALAEGVDQIAFGSVDYCLDLAIDPSSSGIELLHARSQLVLASRVANILPPIDGVFTSYQDANGFKREAEESKRLGFQGKLLIHPNQVELAHGVFSPSEDELLEAEEIIAAFRKAEEEGIASISVQGKMLIIQWRCVRNG
ncbi:CoA ester lyase [Bacillus sp. JCM 19041]|uniref:HpcH/HpaI aldolase/citrate lyase family protein n=1 Tax=Bacillus sp. JCM 19041 TaxID=1460637 RepID=UPI0006CFC434